MFFERDRIDFQQAYIWIVRINNNCSPNLILSDFYPEERRILSKDVPVSEWKGRYASHFEITVILSRQKYTLQYAKTGIR
jgi:hypothetical protein